jgi:hypothetical protein
MGPMTEGLPKTPDHVAVYARRRARMVFLRCHVEGDHPVLRTENHLIEMARSKLLESLLAKHGESGIDTVRPAVESRIRDIMRKSVDGLTPDQSLRDQLRRDMDSEPLDHAFTPRRP